MSATTGATTGAAIAGPVSSAAPAPSPAPRNAGLDALRAALTLLVLFHHTAIVYGAIGGWYYHEVTNDPAHPASGTRLLIVFCTVNQAFFMGLFFLIAGYFTPGAVERNGARGYLRERARRLGIPLLVYCLLIGPATIALARTAEGRPFLTTLPGLWAHGVVDVGPLWFAEALLLFTLGYLAWRALASRPPRPRGLSLQPRAGGGGARHRRGGLRAAPRLAGRG